MSQLLLAGNAFSSETNLQEALQRVQGRLGGWVRDSDAYNALLLQAFGVQKSDASSALQASLSGPGLGIRLEILDGATLSGINGAYASATPHGDERIYLNGAWLQSATAPAIEAVLLEEIGHAIDQRLHGAADTRGDEGEIFSALLRGTTPATAALSEDDHHLISLNGNRVAVEAAAAPAPYMPAPVGSAISFSNHLPKPFVIDARSGGAYTIRETQVELNLGLLDADGMPLVDANGAPVLTTQWVYEYLDPSGTVVGSAMCELPGMPGMTMPGMGTTAKDNPTFLTSSGVPIQVTWINDLPTSGQFLPVDSSILTGMGDMGMTPVDPTMVATVPHLHGGHTAAIYDGYPTDGFTQSGLDAMAGMAMTSSDTYTYDNSQQGSFIWYHDHTMGLTRLNVYAGLEGSYFIEDQNRRNLQAAGVLPYLPLNNAPNESISLLIADRSFSTDGQLYYPGASGSDPLPGTLDTVDAVLPPDYSGPFPTAVPEYYGDTILVNGVAWPHAQVGKGQVEFDMVNGSDSRFYVLKLDNLWAKVSLLGTDGGLLEKPIVIMDGDGMDEQGEQIVFSPADRLQLMFDFTSPNISVSDHVRLLNVGASWEPFKGLNPDGSLQPGFDVDFGVQVPVTAATPDDSVGNIMEFQFAADPLDPTAPDPSQVKIYNLDDNTILNANIAHLSEVDAKVRKLGIFEIEDQFGRIMPMIGTAESAVNQMGETVFGPQGWDAPVTEMVKLGDTEVWDFYNDTADAHPMHVHLGQFEVLGRYYSVPTLDPTTGAATGYELGDLIDTRTDLDGIQNLRPEDTGLQDTVWVGPGEALKVIMNFDRPGDYIWHCHILSHEDHDMMRPFKVLGFAGDITGAITEDSAMPAQGLLELGTVDDALQGFTAGTFNGAYGSLTLNTRGEWCYMVDQRSQQLADGESGSEVFTITELDDITTHTITVTVLGQDDVGTPGLITSSTGAFETGVTLNAPAVTGDAEGDAPDPIYGYQWFKNGVEIPNANASTYAVPISAPGVYKVAIAYTDLKGFRTSVDSAGQDVVDVTPPTISSISTKGTSVILQFSESVSATSVPVSAFVVALGVGDDEVTARAIRQVSIDPGDDSRVVLTLAGTAPASSSNLRVSYIDPAGHQVSRVIQDLSGNDAQSFSNRFADTFIAASTSTLASRYRDLVLTGMGNLNGTGNALNNVITGNGGINWLDGGSGADTLIGGAGNDTYVVSNVGTIVKEDLDAGADLVRASFSYALGANLENLTLAGSASIDGTGNNLNNVITGNEGNNHLDGGTGADTLIGGAGHDTYMVDSSDDVVKEYFNAGIDSVQSSVSHALFTNVENLTLTGSASINGTGNSLNNVITGNAGNNILDGGTGADTLIGGEGNDTYVVGNIADVVTEAFNAGIDTVQASISYSLQSNLEKLTLIGSASINGTGNSLDNVITGNVGNNILDGGTGADTLIGGAGSDTYVVDHVGIVVEEDPSAGTDLVKSSISYALGANVENLTLSGSAAIDGIGNSLNNMITGNAANNILDGGIGADVMTGGAGNDTYWVDNVADVVNEGVDAGTDTVQSSIPYVLRSNLENLTLTGSVAINGTGNTLKNVIAGNGANNLLSGLAGNDELDGSAGHDTLNGGAGTDILTGGAGTDCFQFALADSRLTTTNVTSFSGDVIRDYQFGTDVLDGPTAVTAANMTRLTLAAIATYTDATIIDSLTTNLAAAGVHAWASNRSALVTFDSGASAKTFLVLGDGLAGYQASRDAVIGFQSTGTLATFAIA
jgi:VCBS repeat-containing protein